MIPLANAKRAEMSTAPALTSLSRPASSLKPGETRSVSISKAVFNNSVTKTNAIALEMKHHSVTEIFNEKPKRTATTANARCTLKLIWVRSACLSPFQANTKPCRNFFIKRQWSQFTAPQICELDSHCPNIQFSVNSLNCR